MKIFPRGLTFLEVMEFIHFEALDEDEDIGFEVAGKISYNENLIACVMM